MIGLSVRFIVVLAALAACTERDPLDSDTASDSASGSMSEGTETSAGDVTTAPPTTTAEPPTGSVPGDPTAPTTAPATTGPGQPELSHAAHIQPIWDANCVVGCHTHGGTSDAWIDLSEDAFASLVERPSLELPTLMLVAPGDLDGSYLWHKINGAHLEVGGTGVAMPPAPADPLSADDIDTIAQWIVQGCSP
ncbi:hypothetical protein SAMN02745121_07050 [Nannocystis exedens]|uniref:Cytochrome c domain-containing protein n=1 Tax=Nannocystis exedens TaxID=54 RepID=A0A1I2G5R6_9BACT|nr:hypothetical protein [Nannocystis exedens]PCC67303.1 hypothetical protein NAEX_00306 [Nannocystis exedens]SFF12469.1 hypothetical protein SAMN02745121_07050 [Nannocystis exedens]